MYLHAVSGFGQPLPALGQPEREFWAMVGRIAALFPTRADAAHARGQESAQTGISAPRGPGLDVIRHTCDDDLMPYLSQPTPGDGRIWVVYSYGCADLWQALTRYLATIRNAANLIPIDALFIVAGVPRWGKGQFQLGALGPWHIPPLVKLARCFNVPVRATMPVESCPIQNEAPPTFKNYDCSLFADGTQCDHVTIQRHPLVECTITAAVLSLLTMEANNGQNDPPAAAP